MLRLYVERARLLVGESCWKKKNDIICDLISQWQKQKQYGRDDVHFK